jgi:hypothetical protein
MTITHNQGAHPHHHPNLLLASLLVTATVIGGAVGFNEIRQAKLRDIQEAEVGLQQACQINLSSETIVSNAAKEVATSTQSLKAIPNFPGLGYSEAQNLLTHYAACAQRIEATQGIFTARSLITQVPVVDRNTILSVEQWKRQQSDLNQAIQLLQVTPQDPTIAKQAKAELVKARAKLATVTQRLQQEESAVTIFNNAEALQREAEKLAKNTTNLDNLSNAQQNLREAVQTLATIPANTSVYDRAQQLISRDRQQLQEVELRYARIAIKPILDDFAKFASSLDFTMGYDPYNEKFAALKTQFEQVAISDHVSRSPGFAALATAINQYNDALTVWRYCEEGNCSNSLSTLRIDLRNNVKWLSGDFMLRDQLLTERYPSIEVSTNIVQQRHIQLSEALSKIWAEAQQSLQTARKQLS